MFSLLRERFSCYLRLRVAVTSLECLCFNSSELLLSTNTNFDYGWVRLRDYFAKTFLEECWNIGKRTGKLGNYEKPTRITKFLKLIPNRDP